MQMQGKNYKQYLKRSLSNLFCFCSTNNGTPPAASMSHSFSVDEIKNMRTKLKTSKSYPNDLLAKEKDDQQQQQQPEKEKPSEKVEDPPKPEPEQQAPAPKTASGEQNEENGSDNSSSGVSSEPDIPANNTDTIKKKPTAPSVASVASTIPAPATTVSVSNQVQATKVKSSIVKSQQLNLMTSKTSSAVPKKPILKNPLNQITRSPQPVHHEVKNGLEEEEHTAARSDEEYYDDAELSPSPPSKPFQRHNSLTRKQAATIAMNRATVTTARSAVSLVQLPPPIEGDNEHESSTSAAVRLKIATTAPDNEIVLAPPPQFCDCQHKPQHHAHLPRQAQHHQHQHLHQPQIQHFQQQQQPPPQSQPPHSHHQQQQAQHQLQQLQAQQRVRIVGAVPKANYRLHSQ